MTWTYASFDSAWWPYLFIFLCASLPTLIWRWLGVLFAGDLDENSEWILLVRCISTALVAAVLAQFIFSPNGALASVPLLLRVGAAFIGFAVYLKSRQLLAAILTGEGVLIFGSLIVGVF